MLTPQSPPAMAAAASVPANNVCEAASSAGVNPAAAAEPVRGRRSLRVVVAAAVLLGGVAVGTALFPQLRVWEWYPKRFDVVADGKLYRSGTVTPVQLERLQRERGIRRVISLLNPTAPESVAEQTAAARLGLRWENVPLTGDGASTPADRERLIALLRDEQAGPTLVHCAAGVNRTGLAVGLYRLHVEGWPLERVMSELRAHDFRDRPEHENLRAALRTEAERPSRP